MHARGRVGNRAKERAGNERVGVRKGECTGERGRMSGRTREQVIGQAVEKVQETTLERYAGLHVVNGWYMGEYVGRRAST